MIETMAVIQPFLYSVMLITCGRAMDKEQDFAWLTLHGSIGTMCMVAIVVGLFT